MYQVNIRSSFFLAMCSYLQVVVASRVSAPKNQMSFVSQSVSCKRCPSWWGQVVVKGHGDN